MEERDLSKLSDADLDALFNNLNVDIATTRTRLSGLMSRQKVTLRIVRSTLLNFGGLALSFPTGGLTLFMCALGMSEWVEMIAEDARDYNLGMQLSITLRTQERLLSSIHEEYARRGRLK
ncbi:MAG TPA: hypothetical protein VG889_08410 [Rhizomicrobium sp.]|nr:hypothetical protein [Rhizomicrobium sp.]